MLFLREHVFEIMTSLNYTSLLHRAQLAIQRKEFGQAQLLCEQLLKHKKNDPNVFEILANIAVTNSDFDNAIRYFEQCAALQPKSMERHMDLGWLLSRIGRYRQAIARYEKALRLKPQHPAVLGGLADSYERLGDSDRARELLEPYIKKQADGPLMALIWARLCLSAKKPDEAVAALTRHMPAAGYPAGFLFALGQAYERLEEYEKAFEAYQAANRRPGVKFDLEAFTQRYREVISAFNPAQVAKLPRSTNTTPAPIFIAGRPRAGTTLIEKILDSHPDARGIGEFTQLPLIVETMGFDIGSVLTYPQCIRDLDRTDVATMSAAYRAAASRLVPDKRTVDKNLLNFQYLGIVQALFPESPIIHIRRATIDHCWSIFVADMSYEWTQNLYTLGFTHSLYERLMRHWHEVLDLAILDVDYEAIVDDQEGWTRRILDHCQLPFDERCLRFYEEGANRKDAVSAPTLSYNQVRQPIYKTSVGRASKFERFLGPLHEGLFDGRKAAESMKY